MIKSLTGKQYGNYKTVFFDLDGTLLKSGEGIINAVNYMFERIGMKENDEKRLRAFIGPPVKHHLKDTYGMDEQQSTKAYGLFCEYYHEKGVHESCLYDGVEDMIKTLHKLGIKLHIATGKRETMISPILSRHGLLDYFSGLFGAWIDKGIYNKTQILRNAISRLGALPGDSIIIGDRNHDIIGGRAVGLDTAGVLYGYGDYQELANAGCDYIVKKVADIPKLAGGV